MPTEKSIEYTQTTGALTDQLYRELDAINSHLSAHGDGSAYILQKNPHNAVKPSIFVTRRKQSPAYSIWFMYPDSKPECICPDSHPVDILYRLCEIKTTLYRHFPRTEEQND